MNRNWMQWLCVELVWATWNSPVLLRDFYIFVDICLCIFFVTVYAVELILFLMFFFFSISTFSKY